MANPAMTMSFNHLTGNYRAALPALGICVEAPSVVAALDGAQATAIAVIAELRAVAAHEFPRQRGHASGGHS